MKKLPSTHIITLANLSDTLNLSSSTENNSPIHNATEKKLILKDISKLMMDSIKDQNFQEISKSVRLNLKDDDKNKEFTSYFSKNKKYPLQIPF